MSERAIRASFRVMGVAGLALVAVALAWAFSDGLPAPAKVFGVCTRALAPQPTVPWVATIALTLLIAVSLVRLHRAVLAVVRSRAGARRLSGRPSTVCGREVRVIPTSGTLAFCAGLRRPRIHLSAGLLDLLDDRQLRAVVDHEHHHARRRDPFWNAMRHVVAQTLFFIPSLRQQAERLDEFAEQAADQHAVREAGGDVRPLAGALLLFDSASTPHGAGISPERVDRLTGAPTTAGRPRRELAASAAVLAAVAALLPASSSAGPGTAALHVCLVSALLFGAVLSPVATMLMPVGPTKPEPWAS